MKTQATVEGILLKGMVVASMIIPPPLIAFHMKKSSIPSMVTSVWDVVTGPPRVKVPVFGQTVNRAYTSVPVRLFFDVYL